MLLMTDDVLQVGDVQPASGSFAGAAAKQLAPPD